MNALIKTYCKEILVILLIILMAIVPLLLDHIEHSGKYNLSDINNIVSELVNKVESLFKFKK